jgi:hypothetical protein
MNPLANVTNINIITDNDIDPLRKNTHVRDDDGNKTTSSVHDPPLRSANDSNDLQSSSMTSTSMKRKYLGNNEIIPTKKHHVSLMNHEYTTSFDLDGCNITSISKSPFPNPRKIEFHDFLYNDKLSADFLIYQLDDDSINETNMKTITTSKYKLFFIAEQEEDRRQDSTLAWSGTIYPHKNNIENDSILDSNATFFSNAKQIWYLRLKL